MTGNEFRLERLFRALADRTRLRLLNLMGDAEICVCYLVETLRMPQPKISRHLAYLRHAGIVTARREGKWIHYRIVEPEDARTAWILREVLACLRTDQQMVRDRARLSKLCGKSLRDAPRPVPLTATRHSSDRREKLAR
ncbi:MAG: ArsR family transcriptional regulator [Pyrinomonas sp.]|uniref:ArsR/SmtB family transcription factor n=1 Tax=Pyrinomonas sp. TaxID=2080306 RepID=UPI00331B79D4